MDTSAIHDKHTMIFRADFCELFTAINEIDIVSNQCRFVEVIGTFHITIAYNKRTVFIFSKPSCAICHIRSCDGIVNGCFLSIDINLICPRRNHTRHSEDQRKGGNLC